jgi:hypothetical protein
MNNVLLVLEQQWRGALILVLFLLVLMYVVGKLFWLMGWGRFAKRASSQADTSTWSFFTTQFIAKTVLEFRHLLALLIFLLFAVSVILAVTPGLYSMDVEKMTEGLEGVAAALGGLVGSIIGYYFGEQVASATNRTPTVEQAESRGEAIQGEAAPAGMTPARIRAPQGSDTPEQNP